MKQLILVTSVLLLAFGCAQKNKLTTQTNAYVSVTFKNKYGKDMVIAMVQGALPSQNVTQVPWLVQLDTGNYAWQVPSSPKSNAELLPYIFNIDSGQTMTINVPQYNAAVGFRCLIADTVYKENALQYLVESQSDSTSYMAFPNLITATYEFDKFEAGLTARNPGIWNITAVDFVSIPMQLEMAGTKVGFKDGVTAQGLDSLLAMLPSPYSQGGTIAPNNTSQTYRFFAPSHISTATTVLDEAIIKGISQLNNYKDTVVYGNFTFSGFSGSTNGTPVNGVLHCAYTDLTSGVTSPHTITVNNISTASSFAGTITGPDAGTSETGTAEIELGGLLSAAICRGVLGDPTQWGGISGIPNCPSPWYYYPTDSIFDQYANLIHSYSIGGKNYAFPYDDYFSEEAGITVVAGDSVTVTILPRAGNITAVPESRPPVTPGFISVNIPPSSGYPSDSTGWQIGPVQVASTVLAAGNTIFCSLGDTITCTFPSFPNVMMKIVTANSSTIFSGTVNGGTVTGITGLVYPAGNNTMSFGASAAWTLNTNSNLSVAKKEKAKH